MFIVLWVVMGVVLGGCAGLLLISGLQLSRETSGPDVLSHGGGNRVHPPHPVRSSTLPALSAIAPASTK